ncbi:MAG: NEAT domain-containing protein [Ndongobacter sp.]|nr:NEAT domain-containing protein [Ndongobacter sp.]
MNRIALEQAIANAKSNDEGDYTPTAAALFKEAVSDAEHIFQKEDATQGEIDREAELLNTVLPSLRKKTKGTVFYNGVYTIEGKLWHAYDNRESMGNAALVKPFQIRIEGGEACLTSLYIEFKPLEFMGFKGYLGSLDFFPEWEESEEHLLPTDEQPVETTVEEVHEGVFDDFNRPDGTDPYVKGKEYPRLVSMPIDLGDDLVWARVYVPIMESIMTGGGHQFAKILLDWDTLTQISGVEVNKEPLTQKIAAAKEFAGAHPELSAERVSYLNAALTYTQEIVDDMNADEELLSACENALTAMMKAMRPYADMKVLKEKTAELKAMAEAEDTYTEESVAMARLAVESAEAVLVNELASQEEVDAEVQKVQQAIAAMEERPVNELKDGVYTIQGSMVKTDLQTPSMSNNAIDHAIRLEASQGRYYLTMHFKGMTIGDKKGYLGTLKYFLSGYTKNSHGIPEGKLEAAAVETVHKNDDGTPFTDVYGTNYPARVRYEMIPEARRDGYIPLQVFVPVMEAISTGAGTQPVYLKLDWDSVKPGYTEPTPEHTTPEEQETVFVDEATGIRVTAAAGVFPGETVMFVRELTQGSEYDQVKDNRFIAGNRFKLYDIRFMASGQEVQPAGKVNIEFPIPADFDSSKLSVYHFNEDGSAASLLGKVSGTMYRLSTSSFSRYALVERQLGKTEKKPEAGSKPEQNSKGLQPKAPAAKPAVKKGLKANVKTGDSAFPMLWVMAACAATVLVVEMAVNRKTREEQR